MFAAVHGFVGDLRQATLQGEGETEPKQIGDGTMYGTETKDSPKHSAISLSLQE